MQETGLQLLSHWQNFAMVTGTAAATLTGLMFVASTLIAGVEGHLPTLDAGISAFNTPTVVHFCAVLLLAGILSIPWQSFVLLSLVLGGLGFAGAFYLVIVMQRMRRVPGYETPLRDWLWYLAFPLLAYLLLLIAAILFPANPALALYLIGAVMLALLFFAIHNAWDLVTYLAVDRYHSEK